MFFRCEFWEKVTFLFGSCHVQFQELLGPLEPTYHEVEVDQTEEEEHEECHPEEYRVFLSPEEAENAIDDRSALSLYDCLIPKLKEQRRYRFDREDKF